MANIENFTDGPITYVEDPFENPLVQARELVKDQLRLATTDYTNDTQLPLLLARRFSFIVLTKKSCEERASSIVSRVGQKRNNSSDPHVATPHPSARKRARTSDYLTRSSSLSSGATTNASTSPRVHAIVDLTKQCDCNENFTPNVKVDNKPRACTLCIGTPIAGRVGFTP